MANANDQNDDIFVMDFVNNPIVANTNSVSCLNGLQFLAAVRTGIVFSSSIDFKTRS